MPITRAGWVLALAIAVAGCSQGSSDGRGGRPIPTADLYLTVSLETDDGVTANVTARVYESDRSTEVLLTGGDTLTVCKGPDCATLVRNASDTQYVATLPYEGETDYVISLIRPEEVDATDTVVRIPDPFDILEPATTLDLVSGDSIDIAWSLPPAGASASLLVFNLCYFAVFPIPFFADPAFDTDWFPDPDGDGRVTYAIDDLLPFPTQTYNGCAAYIDVRQAYFGSSDPNLDSGFAMGLYTRTFQVDYQP